MRTGITRMGMSKGENAEEDETKLSRAERGAQRVIRKEGGRVEAKGVTSLGWDDRRPFRGRAGRGRLAAPAGQEADEGEAVRLAFLLVVAVRDPDASCVVLPTTRRCHRRLGRRLARPVPSSTVVGIASLVPGSTRGSVRVRLLARRSLPSRGYGTLDRHGRRVLGRRGGPRWIPPRLGAVPNEGRRWWDDAVPVGGGSSSSSSSVTLGTLAFAVPVARLSRAVMAARVVPRLRGLRQQVRARLVDQGEQHQPRISSPALP